MINSFITNRSQKTIVNNTESDWIALEQSVSQGTVFGPLIFNLYINDLNKQIDKTCKIVQYADDTLLFCENNDPQKAIKALEANCSLLSNYFLEHSLQLNAKKTELIVFSKKHSRKKDEKYTITLDDKMIEEKTKVKYLRSSFRSVSHIPRRNQKYSQDNGMRNKNTSINQKAIASENKTLDIACTGN